MAERVAVVLVVVSWLGNVGMEESRVEEALWDGDPYLEAASCRPTAPLACLRAALVQAADGLFRSEEIRINENLRLLRMPESQLVRLSREPYQFDYSEAGRSWGWGLGEAYAFISRRAERFLKSTALEVTLDTQVTEGGRYQPRFIDEIYNELDTIDYKHEKPQKKYELQKLFIPLLVILKLFKLKLLLFLPLILGVASFKKFLGFLALAVPALIGYLKFCRPGLNYGSFGHSSFYKQPPLHAQDYYDKVSYNAGSDSVQNLYNEPLDSHRIVYNAYTS